jgi:hypothetical protein
MNRERTLWLAIGLLVTSVASVVLGASALSGFSGPSGGDLAVSSTSASTNLLLALGAAGLLGVEFARAHGRTAREAGRRHHAVRAAEA